MQVSYLRHELHTSLNAVVGYSELLLEDATASGLPTLATGLHQILDACHGLLQLVGERLSAERLRGLDRDAVTAAVGEVASGGQSAIHTIVAKAAELVALVEQAGKYGLIPDLCKIQAAGNMLQDLLDRQTSFVVQGGEGSLAEPTHLEQPAKGGGRILVIDDNSMSRDLLRQILERQGHQIDEASGGRQGLEFIAEQPYDLVLLDLRMPDLSGLDVLEQLQERLPQLMVVMLSASDSLDDVARCIERGAVDYLIKPVNRVLLRARISAYLELKRLREQVRALQGAR